LELGETQEKLVVNALRAASEHDSTALGDLEVCPACWLDETSLGEVSAGPMDPIGEGRLLAAREQFGSILV